MRVFPQLVDDGAEGSMGAAGAACLVAQTAGACAFDGSASLVDFCVHDVELDRKDRPNTASCLSAGTRDWASGRVDVPGSVLLEESYEMQQRSAASSVATELEYSVQFPGHGDLSGWKTLMIVAIPDAPVLSLVEGVAKLLGLPATCFYLTVGSKVLRDYMSLAADVVL